MKNETVFKEARFYYITEEQYENTEFRPLGKEVQNETIADYWTMEDYIKENAAYNETIEHVRECLDMNIYKHTIDNEVSYLCELKDMPDKYSPQKKYEKANLVKAYNLRCFKTEQDIVNKLKSVENVSAYIKNLIRKDIKKEGAI